RSHPSPPPSDLRSRNCNPTPRDLTGSGDQAVRPSWVAIACHTCSGVVSRTTSLRISKCLDMAVLLRRSVRGRPVAAARREGRRDGRVEIGLWEKCTQGVRTVLIRRTATPECTFPTCQE